MGYSRNVLVRSRAVRKAAKPGAKGKLSLDARGRLVLRDARTGQPAVLDRCILVRNSNDELVIRFADGKRR